MRVRSNPLLASITLRWNEIVTITPVWLKGNPYLTFALSSEHLEAFLHHQSFLNRIILERRKKLPHSTIPLRADLLPCTVKVLFASIQEQYGVQVQQYSIHFGDPKVFDETPE